MLAIPKVCKAISIYVLDVEIFVSWSFDSFESWKYRSEAKFRKTQEFRWATLTVSTATWPDGRSSVWISAFVPGRARAEQVSAGGRKGIRTVTYSVNTARLTKRSECLRKSSPASIFGANSLMNSVWNLSIQSK